MFSPDLIPECTHLLAGAAAGKKYEYARKWKVEVVTRAWFEDSLRHRHRMDENHFRLGGSNPSKGATAARKEVSANSEQVVATTAVTPNNTGASGAESAPVAGSENYLDVLARTADRRSGVADGSAGPVARLRRGDYLDQCGIHLSGFGGGQEQVSGLLRRLMLDLVFGWVSLLGD